ncbi:MAG: flagellar type III secretion system pore protein FliP [Acidimicrobiia bacterium]
MSRPERRRARRSRRLPSGAIPFSPALLLAGLLLATVTVLGLFHSPDAGAQDDAPATTAVAVEPTTPATPVTPDPNAPVVTVSTPAPVAPDQPAGPDTPADAPSLNLELPTGTGGVTSQPLTIVLLLTVIGLGPSMLLLMTSFTRITIVLGLTRNALSLQGTPPNQVLIGLSLFLTLFVMGPVLSQANEEALQPYLNGEITQQEAYGRGIEPFREFMLDQVRDSDLELFASLSGGERPANPSDVSTATLVPAFVISELRAAFLMGFIIFIPFLVIDIVVSSALMSMGMVMLPPVAISLPFKLLLFVVVDGWQLTIGMLVQSFKT